MFLVFVHAIRIDQVARELQAAFPDLWQHRMFPVTNKQRTRRPPHRSGVDVLRIQEVMRDKASCAQADVLFVVDKRSSASDGMRRDDGFVAASSGARSKNTVASWTITASRSPGRGRTPRWRRKSQLIGWRGIRISHGFPFWGRVRIQISGCFLMIPRPAQISRFWRKPKEPSSRRRCCRSGDCEHHPGSVAQFGCFCSTHPERIRA